MEHKGKILPIKSATSLPVGNGSAEQTETCRTNARWADHFDSFLHEDEIARHTREQVVTSSHINKQPCLDVALSDEMIATCFVDQYELPESPIPAHVENKKHIRVPQIQTMDDYIKHHYTSELMSGMIDDIIWRAGEARTSCEVYDDTFHISRISFWRRSRTEMIALLKMRLDVYYGKNDKIERYEYVAEIFFDFSDDIEYKEICYRPFNRRDEESIESEYNDEMWLLDNHLVPYAKKETIEKRAWEMHWDFFPEECRAAMLAQTSEDATDDFKPDGSTEQQRKMERRTAIIHEYSAFELARRMGLAVIRVPLYNKNQRKSFFNFCESQVQVLQESSDGATKEPIWITIPADTIVINTLRHEPDEGEMSVFHECIHWYWHYLFYRLQELHNSDISALQKKNKLEQDKSGVKESLSCMEYQANRGKYALKMPAPVMRPLVDELIEEYMPGSQNEGLLLERAARRIVEERGIRPYQIRARLIQMGRIGAKGILNFEDGHYITPFAFEHQNGSGDRVFFIRRKEVLEEYQNNQEFRAQLQSGNYVYAEGHVCINDSRYITQTGSGPMLTSWATAHVDKCCLRFVSIYEMTDLIEYEFGRLASDEEYNNHYVNYIGVDGEKTTMAEHVLANHQYVLGLPGDFFDMLDVLRKDKGITQEIFEEKSGISAKKLSRERAKRAKTSKINLTLDETIAICIGLEAPPWLSKAILARAGVSLNPFDSLHIIYEFILSCMFMDSIDAVQRFLKENGFPELALKKGEQ